MVDEKLPGPPSAGRTRSSRRCLWWMLSYLGHRQLAVVGAGDAACCRALVGRVVPPWLQHRGYVQELDELQAVVVQLFESVKYCNLQIINYTRLVAFT